MTQKLTFLPDLFITIPIILLLSLGIVVIYSQDPKLALQQAILSLFGLGIYWILSWFDFGFESRYFKYLYIGILLLLVIVFILGVETRGSVRWIPLGFMQLQPSELAKPVLILFLANFWANHSSDWKNIFKSFLLILPILALIFRQPDLGTVLTILTIWIVILIGANVSIIKLLVMGIISLILTPLSWIVLKDYQKERILSFISPAQDPLGMGYNVIQSMIAVGSGQLLGRGLGRGTQSRLQFLPEFRTDFIFASIAEELGFIAAATVLILYGLIIGRSFQIISQNHRKFTNLLVFGVLGMLFFQIVVNIGMNIGVLPITGITLPLLSYGGSSLISTLISLGIIASVARYSRQVISKNEI
ncbi:MAG: rod shape-determining protein RodA [Candidatus Daviesbacteria bacterium]